MTDITMKHLLLQDVADTLGNGNADEKTYLARRVEDAWSMRWPNEDAREHLRRVVDDVQQVVHDMFVDTTWPACPRHGNHPLWFHDGWWCCEADGVAVAKLGELKTVSRARRRAGVLGMLALLLVMVMASGCRAAAAAPAFDVKDGKGDTVFFILGFLDEYQGRGSVEGDDVIERFYCNEADKAREFGELLGRLMREQGLRSSVREGKLQECLTVFRGREVSERLGAMYLSWRDGGRVGDPTGHAGKPLLHLFSSAEMFRAVGRREKLAYVAGAYARWRVDATGSSPLPTPSSSRTLTMRFANAGHKAALLVDLLRELGATHVTLESTQGFIPQANTIRFVPTDELNARIRTGSR